MSLRVWLAFEANLPFDELIVVDIVFMVLNLFSIAKLHHQNTPVKQFFERLVLEFLFHAQFMPTIYNLAFYQFYIW